MAGSSAGVNVFGGGVGAAVPNETYWGNKGDGNLTVVTAMNAAREYNCDTLTITSTGALCAAGFRIFCHKLVIDAGGILHDDGTNAINQAGGAALAARQMLDARSGAGISGRNTTGNGNAGGAPSAARTPRNNNNVYPAGGAGGGAGVQTGGAGGSAGFVTYSWHTTAWPLPLPPGGGFSGAAGGGCGAAVLNTGTAWSGGGGGGAGAVWVAAKEIINNGRIGPVGGTGGNATTTGNAIAGGGGGGGGGNLLIITNTPSSALGNVTTAGGLGGNGSNGGLAGLQGTSGASLIISYGD